MTAPPRFAATRAPASLPAASPAAAPVAVLCTGWRAGLRGHVRRSRERLLRRLASRIAVVQDRCRHGAGAGERQAGRDGGRRTARRSGTDATSAHLPGTDATSAHLPGWLDRELHLLTLRLSADLDTLCWDLSDRAVCTAFGAGRAGDDTRRVAHAVRTACIHEPDETVLITPAGLATTLRGPAAGDRHRAAAQRANRPFEVALAADCYVMWRERTDFHPAEIDAWLRRALDSVAAELLDAVVQRCDRIHEALTRTIGELAEPAT
jgi:hypothetical protein